MMISIWWLIPAAVVGYVVAMLRCYPVVMRQSEALVKQSSIIEAQKSLIERLRLVIDPGRSPSHASGIEVAFVEDK